MSKLVGRPKARQPGRGTKTGRLLSRASDPSKFEAVISAAMRQGLLGQRSSRIAGRVSRALVEQAKKRTGIESDTELIKFALASVALEDRFPAVFEKSRGSVDPDVKLGF